MKSSLRLLFALFVAGTFGLAPRLSAADSPELAAARAELLEAYQRGGRDSDNQVKQLRERIAALEYIAAAKPASGAESAPAKLINLDFPGGTLAALAALMNRDGIGFNVVGEKADLAIELPPLSLRNADPTAVASAVSGLLMPRGYNLQSTGRVAPGQVPVFYLRKLMPHEFQQAGLSQFQSFQLAAYLEVQSVDDIIGAIRAAWDLDPAHTPAALRLKFHPPTGILLVSGPNEGVFTVQTVLNQLRKGAEPAKSGQKPPPASEKK